ncbi:hypothetical protein [Ornithinimicrobium kibberense]|uniref:hypothetical protein n=1 Tax=Ornithinimicrobium kibberense TaxID=282060 RepID=UPI003612FD27
MQAEAAEPSRSGQGGRDQITHELHRPAAPGEESRDVEVCRAAGLGVGRPPGPVGGALQGDPGAGVPAGELGGAEGVVLPEEVVDRVPEARHPAGEPVGGQLLDRSRVLGRAATPYLLGKDLHDVQG